MRILFYWLAGLLSTNVAMAQTNLVITSPASATPGERNTLIGVRAGMSASTLTSASDNTFGGAGVGQFNSTGGRNTFFGSNVGSKNTTGAENTFIGFAVAAYYGNHVASGNTSVGATAGNQNITGVHATYLGFNAGSGTLTNDNLFVGHNAGLNARSNDVTANTFVGAKAGYYTQGTANTFIGYNAGGGIVTGSIQYNTCVGFQAGLNNNVGIANIMLGANSGSGNRNGSGNFFLGTSAGTNNTSGSYNVYLGTNAGSGENVNGFNNVAIGAESGRANTSNSGNYPNDGSFNTFLGYRADAGVGILRNTTALGANAKTSVSNAIMLGNGTNVGMGTSAPATKLELVSSTSGTSGLRLTNLTSTSSTSLNASKFLTVAATGDVVLANYSSGGRVGASDEGLWERRTGALYSSSNWVLAIGQVVSNEVANYNLLVSQGILTEKVKVAVKNTTEWSDHVLSSGYQLLTLKQVEQHIQTHKHLPGVPSAQEMVERGNDLHQTDALLLAKIEELTLYLIEADQWDARQQREIARLRAENRQIKRQFNQSRLVKPIR
jgi:hypothetical protein